MKHYKLHHKILLSLCFVLITNLLVAQNIAITDDDGYTAEETAMLDVQSLTKGMLVPRLTTTQREAILFPATGLLVFDTNLLSFYFYNGVAWIDLSTGGLWQTDGSGIYMANTLLNMGVGSLTPNGKLEIKGDGLGGPDELIFAVVNSTNDTVFAVYNGGVRIYVDDDISKDTGNRGGFAVGGFSSGKGEITNEFLRVTPDSVRIYVDPDPPGKDTGNRGGFAVGGFSSGKALPTDFMNISKDNYFIGLGAGYSNTDGIYNSFMGYEAGYKNIDGDRNVFIGYQSGNANIGGASSAGDNNLFVGNRSGYENTTGSNNVFLGNNSGYNNIGGSSNAFVGNNSGFYNTSGNYNVFFGYYAGSKNTSGDYNTFIGYQSGLSTTTGYRNAFLGYLSGYENTEGARNIFIGGFAGHDNTTANDNTFVGYLSGRYNTIGTGNVFFGYGSGIDNTKGNNNTYIGYNAANNDTTGNENVVIGYEAGYNSYGSGNVYIGFRAGKNINNSNKLVIDNEDNASPLIYGDFDSDYLEINGDLRVINGDFRVNDGNFLVDDGNIRIMDNPGDGVTPLYYAYQGNANSISKKYAFTINDGLWVTQNVWADNYYSNAKEEFKENIIPITNSLNRVLKTNGVSFAWSKEANPQQINPQQIKPQQIGYMASDIEKVIPEIVFTDTNGEKSISYGKMTVILSEAIKEQQKIIDNLTKRVVELELKLSGNVMTPVEKH